MMDPSKRPTFSGLSAILAILLFTLPRPSTAKSAVYCSTENTSDGSARSWNWQSNGWCNTACQGSHPFGVILGKDCWCSDYIPKDQVDISECSDTCPGYPTEYCGNEGKSLYIYIRLDSDAEVKGTKGVSQPTSGQDSGASKTTVSPKSTGTPNEEVTSRQIITVSGVVVTQTVIYTNIPSSAATNNHQSKKATGAIVGGVIGGLAVLGAIVGAVIFVLWRRRRQQSDEDESGVQRNTSTMSRSGLLKSEKPLQYPPKITTNFNSRSGRTLDNESISPISGSDRRSSRLVFDQRLNPSAIMVLDNPSRGSFASMDDSRDYGRTLNVRNPDPETRSLR